MLTAIRTISSDAAVRVLEGLGIPFGGPFRGSDSYGTRATRESNLHLDLYPDGGPLLYHHGLDPDIGFSRIGDWRPIRTDEQGVWVRAQLDRAHAWAGAMEQLLDDPSKPLGFSAGTRSDNMSYTRGGDWRDWPVFEISLEPMRSNPWAVLTSVRSAKVDDFLALLGAAPAPAAPTDPGVLALRAAADAELAEQRAAAVRVWSEAADDAAMGAGALGTLLYLLGPESDEPDQVAMLQRSIDALTEWINAERAEIGTAEDLADSSPASGVITQTTELTEWVTLMTAMRAGARNSSADQKLLDRIHDDAVTLGASAHNDDTLSASDTGDGDEAAARSAEAQPDPLEALLGPAVRGDAAPLRELGKAAGEEAARRFLERL